MKILFLTHYFPPEVNAPATRTFEHCKEWVKNGHEVTIVTCAPNHPRGQVYDGYKNKIFSTEYQDGIKVIRLWTYMAANKGFAKRILNYLSYFFVASLCSIFFTKQDIVISTSPQFFCGLSGYIVSRIKRAVWVLEIRDLWPESIIAVGAINNKLIIDTLRHMERFAYMKADAIVSVTDAFKDYMVDMGVPGKKISVIKNGVNLQAFSDRNFDSKYVSDLGLENKFIVSYIGTHGMAHSLRTLLEAAYLLKDNSDIHFLLVGDGAERDALLRFKQEMELHNVTMLEQQPKSIIPALWSMTNISAVLLKKSPLFKTVIPSKIFEAMIMSKPIILAVDGESRDIVEAAGAGVFIQPEDPELLSDEIVRLYNDADLRKNMGINGNDYVKKYHDRKILAQNYAEFINGFLEDMPSSSRENSETI